MSSDDGQLLLNYSRKGDVKSLSALVERNSKWLTAFLRGLTASDADAEDCFQEVWVKVIRSCESYRGGSLRAYLTRIARSVVIDRFRRFGRQMVCLDETTGEGAVAAETLADSAPVPSDVFESNSASEDVREAVRSLPVGQREVLLMRIESELSFKEIAEELDIPLGTALTWMHLATVRLRKMLGGK